MGTPAIGSVVLVNFPYSDYLKYKNRPALIIGLADFNNYILCQITSRRFSSPSAILLSNGGFERGGLQRDSNIRPDKIYTVDKTIIEREMGKISRGKMQEVKKALSALFELS